MNYLTYESQVSEILDTADSSDLSGECTRLYVDEAEKKTTTMMGQISDALSDSACGDTVTSVTHTQFLTALGNKVRRLLYTAVLLLVMKSKGICLESNIHDFCLSQTNQIFVVVVVVVVLGPALEQS